VSDSVIRIVIVDDERLARDRIRELLKGEPDAEIVADCADGEMAVSVIERCLPDLLFLDVQMPRMDGFEVLEAIGPRRIPAVVFTTAHDAHAVRAFEVHALDYLLKPFTEARFRAALERARAVLGERSSSESTQHRVSSLLTEVRQRRPGGSRLLVRSPDRVLFLKTDEIDHLEAAGNYAVVHHGTERHIVRETMGALEERLAPGGFMRISRSVIVNLHRVRELQPVEAGSYCVLTKSGARLTMTCPLRDIQQRMSEI
jgi:two-component system LytT family response regulator